MKVVEDGGDGRKQAVKTLSIGGMHANGYNTRKASLFC